MFSLEHRSVFLTDFWLASICACTNTKLQSVGERYKVEWVLPQDGTKNWFHYMPYASLGWSYNSLFQKVIPLQIVLSRCIVIFNVRVCGQ